MLFEIVGVKWLRIVRRLAQTRNICFHFLLEQLGQMEKKLMGVMLFVRVEPTLEKGAELFYFNRPAVSLIFRILFYYLVQYVVDHLFLWFVVFHIQPSLSNFYFLRMYPFRCSFDISICKIDIIKHKLSGFYIPAGGRPNFLVTIGITGKVESLARVGPPP